MKNILFIVISVFIILYIIDRKKPSPLLLQNNMHENLSTQNYIDILSENIINSIKEINPLKTDYVWTYIEIDDISLNHQNLYKNYSVNPFYIECIKKMKESIVDLVILTPMNIRYYLPDFDLIMSPKSPIDKKKRIDILFSQIIENYGGLCISPGTIVYNIQPILNRVGSYDLVTIGDDLTILNNYDNKYHPNNYIIGGKKDTPFIQEYSRVLINSIESEYENEIRSFYDIKHLKTQDILADVIQNVIVDNDIHYHFNSSFDGTIDENMRVLTLDDYLGTQKIAFKDNLLGVSFPYDKLSTNIKYRWFRDLNKGSFKISQLEINRLLNI